MISGYPILENSRSVPGDDRTTEAIIDAGANDVGGDAYSFGNAWHDVEVLVLSEINVQVLKLCRPVRREGGFYACPSCPARTELAARCGSERVPGMDVSDGKASGPVKQPIA